jgi:hypothetical protein
MLIFLAGLINIKYNILAKDIKNINSFIQEKKCLEFVKSAVKKQHSAIM